MSVPTPSPPAEPRPVTFIPELSTRQRRRALGVSVVGLVVLLQLMVQVVAGHDRNRILSNMAFLAVEVPLLMGALSFYFARATQLRLGSFRTVATGVLFAGALGMLLGTAFFVLGLHFPDLRVYTGPLQFHRSLLLGLTYSQLHFGLWTLGFVFPYAVEDARVRALETEKLLLEAEKLKSAAELARLRAHLEPHFLLNTLNAIAGLVTDDPREARRLLACLGDLLRDALRDEDEMQTLDAQMAWLRRYAEILEARHVGSLVFRWEIASETRDIMMPRLLLQPLVENAVKHGALKRRGGGEVVIRAHMVSDESEARTPSVECSIEDNGPGIPDLAIRSGAFGLHAVRRRLELKYSGRASLRLESSDAGTRSIVALPHSMSRSPRAS